MRQDGREVAGQPLQQHPLLAAVEEDDVDRGRLRLARLGTGDGEVDDGLHEVAGPPDEQVPFLRGRVRRPGGGADDRLPGDRLAVLARDDQRTEQVHPPFEVVVLGVQVHPHEVGVQVGLRHRERAVPLAGDVRQRAGAVAADRLAEALGPVDQLVEPLADRPRRRDLLDLGLAAGGGDEFVRRHAADGRGEVLERGEGLDGGDAGPAQGVLVGAGDVRQQREVFRLRTPLHAELVVQAAVALEAEAYGTSSNGVAATRRAVESSPSTRSWAERAYASGSATTSSR